MRKILIAGIAVSVVSGIVLLISLSQYLDYLGVVAAYEKCEKQASELPDQEEREKSSYYCGRVFAYNTAAHDIPIASLVLGIILGILGTTLFAMNYKPSLFTLKRTQGL